MKNDDYMLFPDFASEKESSSSCSKSYLFNWVGLVSFFFSGNSD